jgi:hypothetical protein
VVQVLLHSYQWVALVVASTTLAIGSSQTLFTASVATSTVTPTISFSVTNQAAHTALTNSASISGAPSFAQVSPLSLASSAGTPSSSTYYRGDGQWQSPSSGNIFGNITSVSSSISTYSLLSTDGLVVMNTTGTAVTINLPDANTCPKRPYYFCWPSVGGRS